MADPNGENQGARWTQGLALFATHSVLLWLVTLTCFVVFGVPARDVSVVRFDAAHYQTIAFAGYEGFLAAFFPMFPLIWKALGVGPVGISLVNAVTYTAALWFLWREFKPSFSTTLFWCLAPSALFYFLPYSESVFFAAVVVMIVGVRRGSLGMTCAGLLACTLARPAFTVLIPALLLTELLCTKGRVRIARNMTAYLVACALGLLAVAGIQHADTGCWTCFYSVQSGWGNGLRLPTIPLSSWGGSVPVRLDAMALLVGLVALGFLGVEARRRLRQRVVTDRVKVLAMAYLAGISCLVLFMRGGELFSLNRFVFATPFFLVFLATLGNFRVHSNRRTLIVLWLGLMAYFLVFGSYVHIQVALGYALFSAMVGMVVLSVVDSGRNFRLLLPVSAVLLFSVQVLLLYRYLTDQWVA